VVSVKQRKIAFSFWWNILGFGYYSTISYNCGTIFKHFSSWY